MSYCRAKARVVCAGGWDLSGKHVVSVCPGSVACGLRLGPYGCWSLPLWPSSLLQHYSRRGLALPCHRDPRFHGAENLTKIKEKTHPKAIKMQQNKPGQMQKPDCMCSLAKPITGRQSQSVLNLVWGSGWKACWGAGAYCVFGVVIMGCVCIKMHRLELDASLPPAAQRPQRHKI
jgi:hypothetical protein